MGLLRVLRDTGRVFVEVLEGGSVVRSVGLLLSGAGWEGGDAKGICVDGGDGGVVEV